MVLVAEGNSLLSVSRVLV